MLSKSAGRVAWSAPPKSCCANTAAVATARSLATKSSTVSKPTHQRRQSSSKASHPPGSSRNSEPATEDTTSAAAEDEKRSGNGRLSRRRSRESGAAEKAAIKARDEAFANIPAVPSTNHLQLGDVHTSSFFSLHRPISVTTPIPPVDNPRIISLFDSIFKPQPPPTSNKTSDVIYTISNAVSALDTAQSREEKDLRWEILQQSSSNAENANANRRSQRASNVVRIDGAQQQPSLDELIKNFRPFNVPPPPVPFDDSPDLKSSQHESQNQDLRNASEQEIKNPREEEPPATQLKTQRSSRKTFTTTLTMTEVTSPSGQKTYSASASPIVERSRQPRPRKAAVKRLQLPRARQPFLQRLYERQVSLEDFLEDRAENEGREMWAISVKRQRKLKMKKHKYKKLMRRTRNLRRREGRN